MKAISQSASYVSMANTLHCNDMYNLDQNTSVLNVALESTFGIFPLLCLERQFHMINKYIHRYRICLLEAI